MICPSARVIAALSSVGSVLVVVLGLTIYWFFLDDDVGWEYLATQLSKRRLRRAAARLDEAGMDVSFAGGQIVCSARALVPAEALEKLFKLSQLPLRGWLLEVRNGRLEAKRHARIIGGISGDALVADCMELLRELDGSI
jgi:hypothetical protein